MSGSVLTYFSWQLLNCPWGKAMSLYCPRYSTNAMLLRNETIFQKLSPSFWTDDFLSVLCNTVGFVLKFHLLVNVPEVPRSVMFFLLNETLFRFPDLSLSYEVFRVGVPGTTVIQKVRANIVFTFFSICNVVYYAVRVWFIAIWYFLIGHDTLQVIT